MLRKQREFECSRGCAVDKLEMSTTDMLESGMSASRVQQSSSRLGNSLTRCRAAAAGGTAELVTGQRPLLLVTTVDIGEGKSDKIEVREGDEPMDVAQAFVVKHKLPQAIIPRLALHLEDNLVKVVAQKQAAQQVWRHLLQLDEDWYICKSCLHGSMRHILLV